MGAISKILGIVGFYAAGKLLLDSRYDEIRSLLWKNLKILKPYFLQILDSYHFNTFGVDNIVVNHQKKYVDEQIKILKQAIKHVDFDDLGKTVVNTLKDKQE